MLKFDIQAPEPLSLLVKSLLDQKVDIYLMGYLHEPNMAFLDIDWESSAKLQNNLPEHWTLIYAYFLSGEAIKAGQPDPLIGDVNFDELLRQYTPKGLEPEHVEDHKQALIDQANYLMQFPPSRLVYLGQEPVINADVDHILSMLS